MFIGMRRAEGLDGNEIVTVSNFCSGKDFEAVLMRDSRMETPRVFQHFNMENASMFLIKHTAFIASELPHSLYVTHVARHALVNLFSIGIEPNQNNILYWVIIPMVPVLRWSEFGLLACTRPPEESFEINILATPDGLVIAADDHNYSTVVSVERLVFHPT